MSENSPISPDMVIDSQPVGRFQLRVFALCAACLFLEGFDAQAIAYAAPAIVRTWKMTASSMGPVLSAGPLGLLAGVVCFGMLSDRFGRRPTAILCVAGFGLGTLATVATNGIGQLALVRLAAGFALGGTIPIAYALTVEFCPKQRRAAVAMIMGAGLPLGIAAGGPIAAALIPRFGWRSIFYAGGFAPLLLALVLVACLPESIRFLALRPTMKDRVAALFAKMYPNLDWSAPTFAPTEPKPKGPAVVGLFAKGRYVRTLLAWTMVVMNMLTYYGLLSWLPIVIAQSGLSFQRAAITTSLLPFSGILAALTVGWIADRFNACLVLACLYIAGGLFTILIGQAYASPGLLLAVTACAGFGLIGGQNASNPVVLALYPTYIRATGFGWANAVGRIGSIAGPLLGAVMLSLHWSPPKLFLIAALPATCAALAAFALTPFLSEDRKAAEPADSRRQRTQPI
jgi:MFS transporter, AAHS family, 4-hydroxybenzoate transporter